MYVCMYTHTHIKMGIYFEFHIEKLLHISVCTFVMPYWKYFCTLLWSHSHTFDILFFTYIHTCIMLVFVGIFCVLFERLASNKLYSVEHSIFATCSLWSRQILAHNIASVNMYICVILRTAVVKVQWVEHSNWRFSYKKLGQYLLAVTLIEQKKINETWKRGHN